jgi:hypothetical protein
MTDNIIQELSEQESLAKQQVQVDRAKFEALEVELPRSE